MTYSPLITETMPPRRQSYGDKWSARPPGVHINGLIVHHHATTTDAGIGRLVESADKASANYIIRDGGGLIGSVPEEYRAWTSGSYAADDDKITVEVQNQTAAPDWLVSAEAFATLVRLYADVAQRYRFAPTRSNIFGHRDFAATSCPGPYLYPRLADVAEQAAGTLPVTTPIAIAPDTRPRNADGSLTLREDGVRGVGTIGRWQEVMGTLIDWVISKPRSALIEADQRFLNSVVAAASIQDLTGKPALDLDGDEGPKTIRVRQFWLYNTQTGYLGRAPRVADFDGHAGPETTRLHQHALNLARAGSGRY